MNKDLTVTQTDGSWPVGRLIPGDPAPSYGPPSEGPALDLKTLVRIVKEWRWLILGATAAGLALAVLVTLLSSPLYRARVTLEVNPPTVEILDEKSENDGAIDWDFAQTQASLLESRSVAERAAQELNLAGNPEFADQEADPADRLRQATDKVHKGIDVTIPEGRIIHYTYVSGDPERAAQIANALADAFINSGLQRRYESSAYARDFLQKQIAKTRADLERSEKSLVAYAQAQGIINMSTGEDGSPSGDGATLQGQSLGALNEALAAATARRVAAEGAYRQGQTVGTTSEVAASAQQLKQSRAALEAEYQEKRTLMKPEHPEMQSLRSRITELDRQISRETSSVASGRSNSLLADYRAALAAEQALQNRVAQLKGQVLDLRGRSVQYQILQRDVDTNRALYDALLQRYKQIGVAGGIGTTPVSIVDRAQVPSGPFKPRLWFNILLGLALGAIAGLLGAIGLEFVNDTIKTRSDVRSKLGLACLGAVPKRTGKQPLVEDLEDPSSAISEAYSSVATSLRFTTDHGMPKAVLVTSARAAEGKSSSALALAQNLARRGMSVLLIDADLRKPAFRAATDEVGLTKLLTADESIYDHVAQTQFEHLWLLASGPIPPNPADLLATGRFQAILREACSQFEMVVIDAPPVLGLADAPLLASVCRDVMFVIESGKTRTAVALEAINRLRYAGGHILGATLTKSPEESSRYSYGYGYGKLERREQEIIMIPAKKDA